MGEPSPNTGRRDWIESERRYHNEHAADYFEKYGRADLFQVPESIYLFSRIHRQESPTVLEVACGPAVSLARHLSRQGTSVRYIGVDISDSLLRYGQMEMPGGTFLLADGSRLPMRPSSVDVVVALGGLHHIPDLQATCDGLFQILKPGGLMLLREPSLEAFGDRWEGDSEHERGIDPNELIAISERYGGVVEVFRRFNSECFHSFRHLLHATRLYHLVEPFTFYWHIKTRLDVAASRWIGPRWPWFRGLDFCLAIRKGA